MKKPILFREMVGLQSGTPQFRIAESVDASAPIYDYYTQADLDVDFWQIDTPVMGKQVRTHDPVAQLDKGDIVFSLISGKAVRVQGIHAGRLMTQNYIKLTPKPSLDPAYLIYLLNENTDIARQFGLGMQGSFVMKYTVKQLKELTLPALPNLDIQRLIGDSYLKSIRLATLKKQLADSEYRLILTQLNAITQHGATP